MEVRREPGTRIRRRHAVPSARGGPRNAPEVYPRSGASGTVTSAYDVSFDEERQIEGEDAEYLPGGLGVLLDVVDAVEGEASRQFGVGLRVAAAAVVEV